MIKKIPRNYHRVPIKVIRKCKMIGQNLKEPQKKSLLKMKRLKRWRQLNKKILISSKLRSMNPKILEISKIFKLQTKASKTKKRHKKVR